MDTNEKLLKRKELSQTLNISEVQIEKFKRQGMPYLKLGRRLVRFNLTEVYDWLQKRSENTKTEAV